MRVVFMGTPSFAVPALEALADSHDVVGVVTQPDRPRGRGREPVASAVKQAAVARRLRVLQPVNLDETFLGEVVSVKPDVICVAAYGRILKAPMLELPRFGAINVHASLLPRYRGAAPVHRAILDGDDVTGVSIMRMEEGLDTGPVALERELAIGSLDANQLMAGLAHLGADALLEVLEWVSDASVTWVPQPAEGVSYANKITAEDVAIDPSLSVSQVLRRVRASTRSARAKVCVDGTTLDVVKASEVDDAVTPGALSSTKTCLAIGVADGAVSLDEIRPPGKSDMAGCAYARGARLDGASAWTCPS